LNTTDAFAYCYARCSVYKRIKLIRLNFTFYYDNKELSCICLVAGSGLELRWYLWAQGRDWRAVGASEISCWNGM